MYVDHWAETVPIKTGGTKWNRSMSGESFKPVTPKIDL